MKSVLLTPGGSGMAVTAIKALRKQEDVQTVATDINELSPGLHLADTGYLVPRFDDPDYMNAIFDIVHEESIDVVIPALDPILKRFARRRDEFHDRGSQVLISEIETLKITQDKWNTYQHLADSVSVPESWIQLENVPEGGEYFIKPREGSGSEDAYYASSRDELKFHFERVSDPIVQTHLPGKEYTIDCLTDSEGSLVACVPRLRKEITSGISTKVEVVHDSALITLAQVVAEELSFVGPFFIQAKIGSDGVPRVIEIGARTAGTMCGEFVTPSLQYLGILQLCDESVPEPAVHFGSQISRYWSEQYFDDDGFENVIQWSQ
ncbi:ATP-grasp domain-containing protein [Halosimplex pelagicum]|uniref:ATP-grasp domain-containing protein n=1 Tax=Halosimplex pelagicum TaxID=869886 RepID=A0A7D5P9L6_9EURY|nr:ATP-grasp domain-containing protein [Halosimplex pelagicum]QLH81205.1 ATP-grasp domain-containing protein [Halosimplex pelagicum]